MPTSGQIIRINKDKIHKKKNFKSYMKIIVFFYNIVFFAFLFLQYQLI